MKSHKFSRPVLLRRRLSTFTGVEFLLSLCLSFLLFACSDMALNEDSSLPKPDKGIVTSPGFVPGANLGGTVSLQKVDLYLNKGSGATGILSVTIRTLAGAFIDSTTVAASSLATGGSWKTFYFQTGAHIQQGQHYQIRVHRSDRTNISRNDYIFWYASRTHHNAYPEGINDLTRDTWVVDYAFRTYAGLELDQRQLNTVNAFPVSNDAQRWQEFVVGPTRVNLTSIQLYCRFGRSMSANDRLHVRIQGLWASESSDSLKYTIKLPFSQLQNDAWNEIPIAGSLMPGKRYNIVVGRGGGHHYDAGEYFYWCRSNGTVDLYQDGENYTQALGPYPDCAFRTISINGIDQTQENTQDTVRVAYGRWVVQSFTPRR